MVIVLPAASEWGAFSDREQASHRFNGKIPVEGVIHIMKALVEYDAHLSVCAMLHANF